MTDQPPLPTPFDLHGRAFLVAGAGAGEGWAIACALAGCGARVALLDQNPALLDEAAATLRVQGAHVAAFEGDISNRFQAAAGIEAARDAFGRLHGLVNAAGVRKGGAMTALDEWDWRRALDVNLTGAFFLTQLVCRVLADDGGGAVLLLGANTHQQGVGYAASKAGLLGVMREAARDYGPRRVRVNALLTGAIATADNPSPDVSRVALGRAGTPDDVADAALFLLSDAARFVTGQALAVDGGEGLA